MKLPKKAVQLCHFLHKDQWYLIARLEETYILYREESKTDFTQLSTSKNPLKLEQSVYGGAIK